jgi:hypothetical protein
MAETKKKRAAKKSAVKLTVAGSCEMFATFAMARPLCKVTIPANTQHKCGRESSHV